MHRHNVYFWLKEELSSSDLLEFEKGLETLTMIPSVINGDYGKPANTNRAVVDNTYSYGLTLVFKDTTDHNLYQAGPIHLAFVDKNETKWTRALVFDVETK
jgi:hypothetical protein